MCKSPLNINSRLVYIFLKMVELVSRFLVIVIEGCSNLLSTSNLWSSTPFLFICMLCNLYFSFGMLEKIAVHLLRIASQKMIIALPLDYEISSNFKNGRFFTLLLVILVAELENIFNQSKKMSRKNTQNSFSPLGITSVCHLDDVSNVIPSLYHCFSNMAPMDILAYRANPSHCIEGYSEIIQRN